MNPENPSEKNAAGKKADKERRIRVGITAGDVNGVGYELIFKTFAEHEIFELCTPVVYGAPQTASFHRKALGSQTNFIVVSSGREAHTGHLNMVAAYDEEVKVDFGRVTKESGAAAFWALEKAVDELKSGAIDVLVTAPICKEAIQSEQFHFSGHTEYLSDRLGGEPLMVLMNERLRIAFATTHLPLRAVPDAITPELLENKLKLFRRALAHDFRLSDPRIAVLGLNPHNGDGGVLGDEERKVIGPTVTRLRSEGMNVFGPYPADGFFGAESYRKFDGVLAMYHDQGLAPFKALSMDDGVNFTAGLPFVRTSPDHGTAFDIAGRGLADPRSFRCAIFSALDIFRNRRQDDAAFANPLPKLFVERKEEVGRRPRPPFQRGENATENPEKQDL